VNQTPERSRRSCSVLRFSSSVAQNNARTVIRLPTNGSGFRHNFLGRKHRHKTNVSRCSSHQRGARGPRALLRVAQMTLQKCSAGIGPKNCATIAKPAGEPHSVPIAFILPPLAPLRMRLN